MAAGHLEVVEELPFIVMASALAEGFPGGVAVVVGVGQAVGDEVVADASFEGAGNGGCISGVRWGRLCEARFGDVVALSVLLLLGCHAGGSQNLVDVMVEQLTVDYMIHHRKIRALAERQPVLRRIHILVPYHRWANFEIHEARQRIEHGVLDFVEMAEI